MARIAREIYADQGLPGFFKGFGTTQIRAFLVNAITFGAYELVVAAFRPV